MVLVAMQKLVVSPEVIRRGWSDAIDGKAPKLMLSAYGMQFLFPGKITWTQKPYILRNPPTWRIYNPTPAQIEARITLGDTARGLRGHTGKAPLGSAGKRMPAGTIVPRPAAEIQATLKGRTYTGRISDVRHHYHRGPHTLEELKQMRTTGGARLAGATA